MLDFLLVLSAWAFFVLETALDATIINPSCLRVIRCLRQLRAAGFISHVRAALSYWAFLLNVVMVLLLTLVIFGVLGIQVCHYMPQPLVELCGGCMVALKVSWCGIIDLDPAVRRRAQLAVRRPWHGRDR